jgi:hypothetical protein
MNASPHTFAALFASLRTAKQVTHQVLDETAPGDDVRKRVLDGYFGACRETFALINTLLRNWQPNGKAH